MLDVSFSTNVTDLGISASFGSDLCICSNLEQVSISSTFYAQLLCAKIPKSAKKTDNLSIFFALLESLFVKAASKMLMKFTPGVNFINILCVHCLYESASSSFSLVMFLLWQKYKSSFVQKMRT
jgi:hypothetical protein